MNKHHPLCYNNYTEDEDCELCWVINYVIDSITPECSCGIGMDGSYLKHTLPCLYGSFTHSQQMGGRHE